MTKEKAKQCAQDRANKTGRNYVIVQSKNGQWFANPEKSPTNDFYAKKEGPFKPM